MVKFRCDMRKRTCHRFQPTLSLTLGQLLYMVIEDSFLQQIFIEDLTIRETRNIKINLHWTLLSRTSQSSAKVENMLK